MLSSSLPAVWRSVSKSQRHWLSLPMKRGRQYVHNRIIPTAQVQVSNSQTRLMGSKAGVPGNPPGEIMIENIQEVLPDIDEEKLRTTMEKIREIIGYPTYDVALYLVEDDIMTDTNSETRGIDKPTDILSFPFHEPIEAGILQDPEFEEIPEYFSLGEMMVDVPYVMRGCQEDAADEQSSDNDDDEEWEDDDRGVSGAMATVDDPEARINMLLVHGMLHLVGHDHEEDDEYEIMVAKEEEIMKELGMTTTKAGKP